MVNSEVFLSLPALMRNTPCRISPRTYLEVTGACAGETNTSTTITKTRNSTITTLLYASTTNGRFCGRYPRLTAFMVAFMCTNAPAINSLSMSRVSAHDPFSPVLQKNSLVLQHTRPSGSENDLVFSKRETGYDTTNGLRLLQNRSGDTCRLDLYLQ